VCGRLTDAQVGLHLHDVVGLGVQAVDAQRAHHRLQPSAKCSQQTMLDHRPAMAQRQLKRA
jgi:hypothetical protein